MTVTPAPSHSRSEHVHDLDAARVADVMHRGILRCTPGASLQRAAALMVAHRVHCVVVDGGDDGGPGERRIWGLLSAVDVARAVAGGSEMGSAGALAATEALAVAPACPLRDAAALMADHDVAHLVVTSEATGRPIGVLSVLDVARAVAGRRVPTRSDRLVDLPLS